MVVEKARGSQAPASSRTPRSSSGARLVVLRVSRSRARFYAPKIMSERTQRRSDTAGSNIDMQKHLVAARPPRSTRISEDSVNPETEDQHDRVLNKLVELRWHREVVERWMGCSLAADSKLQLEEMLSELDRELRVLEAIRESDRERANL